MPTVHRALADAGVTRRRRRRRRRHLRARARPARCWSGSPRPRPTRSRWTCRCTGSTTWPRTSPSTSWSTARWPSRRSRCWSPAGTARCCWCPTSPATSSPLGRTVDDAAGEAFDKVARVLGHAVPGRPADRQGGPRGRPGARSRFPRGLTGPRDARLRLLLLRAEDRGRPLGRGAASGPASRCRSPTSPRRSRRRWPTCSPPRRCAPAATTASTTWCSAGEWRPTRGCARWPRSAAPRPGIVLRVPQPEAVHRQRRDGRRARLAAGRGRRRAVGARPGRRQLAADRRRHAAERRRRPGRWAPRRPG